jgi:flagellar motor switch protein FliM
MADDVQEMDAGMAAAMGGDDSTLSQDEIDNLLGFSDENLGPTTGVQALLDKSQENYERLPMLEVVFDRFVRTASTSMRNLTGENVDISIDAITSMRFEDYLNSVPLPALLEIFQAVEWENYGIVTIDSSLTYAMVDILLGGGRQHRNVRIEGRPYTTIEQDIVRSMTRIVLEDMETAFNPLTPATFRHERLESNPRFATITRPANPVILVSLRVEMDDRGGKIEILLPYATLEPIKDLLIQMFSGESFGADSSWENHLADEVKESIVTIEAKLDEKKITLRELANLQVGSTIIMNNTPTDDVGLYCRNIPIFSGNFGASGKNLAININNTNTAELKKLL